MTRRRKSTFAGRCWQSLGLVLLVAAVVCALGYGSTWVAAMLGGR